VCWLPSYRVSYSSTPYGQCKVGVIFLDSGRQCDFGKLVKTFQLSLEIEADENQNILPPSKKHKAAELHQMN